MSSWVKDAAPPSTGVNIYERIGVHPLVNCKGTFTIISGSQSLPEVKRVVTRTGSPDVATDIMGVEQSDVLLRCAQGGTFADKWISVLGGPLRRAGKPAPGQVSVFAENRPGGGASIGFTLPLART